MVCDNDAKRSEQPRTGKKTELRQTEITSLKYNGRMYPASTGSLQVSMKIPLVSVAKQNRSERDIGMKMVSLT